MGKTLQEILDLCQEKDIQIVDFKMTDIDGRWRHLSIPVGRLNEETMQYGIGFDGSNYGYAPVESSDMVFVPDLDSATVDPFAEVPTLTMIGDVMIIDRPANRPFDQYPRNVAKRAIGYMQELGMHMHMHSAAGLPCHWLGQKGGGASFLSGGIFVLSAIWVISPSSTSISIWPQPPTSG